MSGMSVSQITGRSRGWSCLARRRTRRWQGAGEHASERTLRCVSERAEPATQPPAVPRRAEVTATRRSSAHGVVFVDKRRLLVPVDRDDDRQPHRRLAGSDRQILVVTHLPQVAAWATTQVTVHKLQDDDSTASVAQVLRGKERTVELARMLSGSPESRSARKHAAELLDAAAAARGTW